MLQPSTPHGRTISKCSVKGKSTITGTGQYVGGIAGDTDDYSYSYYCYYSFSSCLLNGEISVSGGNSTGGIAGSLAGGDFSNCLAKGEITITGANSTGGILGYLNSKYCLTRCGFEGTVTGAQNTGRLVGFGRVGCSYVSGDVTGTEYVGGLSGHYDYSLSICNNSYHIGNTTGTGVYVGGIAGLSNYTSYTPYNCYSYGTTSSRYGISYSLSSSYYTKNLTSEPHLAYNISNDNCNCGPEKTFLSKLSIINGDEAYSTQVWKNIDAQCPLLQWQADLLNGNIEIPGFGEEDW